MEGVSADTCIPDFERLVVHATTDDGFAVMRVGNRADTAIVRILLLRLELQGSCGKRGGAQVWAR